MEKELIEISERLRQIALENGGLKIHITAGRSAARNVEGFYMIDVFDRDNKAVFNKTKFYWKEGEESNE